MLDERTAAILGQGVRSRAGADNGDDLKSTTQTATDNTDLLATWQQRRHRSPEKAELDQLGRRIEQEFVDIPYGHRAHWEHAGYLRRRWKSVYAKLKRHRHALAERGTLQRKNRKDGPLTRPAFVLRFMVKDRAAAKRVKRTVYLGKDMSLVRMACEAIRVWRTEAQAGGQSSDQQDEHAVEQGADGGAASAPDPACHMFGRPRLEQRGQPVLTGQSPTNTGGRGERRGPGGQAQPGARH